VRRLQPHDHVELASARCTRDAPRRLTGLDMTGALSRAGPIAQTALDYTLTDEVKKYRECSACNSMTMWSWQGQMHEG